MLGGPGRTVEKLDASTADLTSAQNINLGGGDIKAPAKSGDYDSHTALDALARNPEILPEDSSTSKLDLSGCPGGYAAPRYLVCKSSKRHLVALKNVNPSVYLLDSLPSGAPKAPCPSQVAAILVGVSTSMCPRGLSRTPCADNDDTVDGNDDEGENDGDTDDDTDDVDDTDDKDGDEAATDANKRADKADYRGAEWSNAGQAPAAQKLLRAKRYYDYAGACFHSHPGSGFIVGCADITSACGLHEQTRESWEPMIRKLYEEAQQGRAAKEKQSIRRPEEYAR